LARRVLYRIAYAEARELNPHFQSDYRIAWITVLFASRGYPQPDVAASYAVLGLHPAKIWPAIIERRKALLGAAYDSFWGDAWPPKKPAQSVSWPEVRKRDPAA
jgi:hypothetical protein